MDFYAFLNAYPIRALGWITRVLAKISTLSRFAPDFLATRQSQLQKYLVQVLSIPGLADHRVLKSFLEVEGHIEHHQTPTPGLNHEEDQSAFHPNLDEPMYTLDLPTSKMNQIVEQTVTRLIDVSSAFDGPGYAHEIPGSEHANQRKMEILQSLPHHVYQTPLNWPKIPSQKIRETNVELEDHAFVRTLMRELSSTLEGHGFTIQEPSQSLIAAL